MKVKEKRFPIKLLTLALVILTNPVVNIFDYLPDFIGYFIIFRALGFFVDRAPYFAEAAQGFKRLLYISLAKIPSYFIMTYVRGHNVSDNDIKSLFTFTFTVIEAIVLIGAIKNLFDAFAYLGQRSNAVALIGAYSLSERTERLFTPDKLQIFCYVFIGYKAALTVLPEMLLLTRGVDASMYDKVFNLARLYPYVIIFSFVSVLTLGIILTKRFSKYLKAIYSEGKAYIGAESLIDESSRANFERKLTVKALKSVANALIAISLLTVNIHIDSEYRINILPGFILGIVAIFVIDKYKSYLRDGKPAFILGVLYTLASAISYAIEIRFSIVWGYGELAFSDLAKKEYLYVIFASAAQCIMFIALFISLAGLLTRFTVDNTGLDPHNPNYSGFDAKYHLGIKKKVYLWCGLAILSKMAYFADAVFRYFAKAIFVSGDNEIGIISEGLIPWFGIVITVCSGAFILFSLYFFAQIKEEIELKIR